MEHLGTTTKGRREPGHVGLKSDSYSLQLFFASRSLDKQEVKWELIERLYNFCGLSKCKEPGREPRYILSQILDTDSQEDIDRLLDQAAIPALVSDEEVAEAAKRLQNRHQREYSSSRHSATPAASDSPWATRQAFIERKFRGNSYIRFGRPGSQADLLSASSPSSNPSNTAPPSDVFARLQGTSAISGHFPLSDASRGSARGRKMSRRACVDEEVMRRGEEVVSLLQRDGKGAG